MRILACYLVCWLIVEGSFFTTLLSNQVYSQEEQEQEDPEVKKVINKGLQAILGVAPKSEETGIYLYTLVKLGVSVDHPKVQSTLQTILGKCQGQTYKPTHDHIYETALDIIALHAMEREEYKVHIVKMVNYLTIHQMDNGGWFYLEMKPGIVGDTSMIQYAMLGYWNAGMSGIELDANVLNKAANWLLKYQGSDGGFQYQPHNTESKKLTMTSAGVGALGVARLLVYGDRAEQHKRGKTLGILIDNKSEDKNNAIKIKGKPSFKAAELDDAADKGIDWIIKNYDKTNNPQFLDKRFVYYYCYTLERMTAIHNLKTLGSKDWYQDGFLSLKKSQNPQGLWVDGYTPNTTADSCFALLFLKKATNKVLKRNELLGSGLLVGGRGLPDKLSDATKTNSGNVTAKKSLGTMDDLLAELEKTQVVDLESTQQAIVETVQLGKPAELIGQREKLLKLVEHAEPDIRKTALWALSRCSVLEDAGVFYRKLDDPNLDVAVEARNGLCWLSHQIKGLGEPASPNELLSDTEEWDSITEERKQEVIKKWRLDAKGVWEKWYYKNRPYELRDDLVEPLPKEK